MRATVRRIDLTRSPIAVELWPSLDWLDDGDRDDSARLGSEVPDRKETSWPGPRLAAPQGRRGLWDAMAMAVQRAREASLSAVVQLDPEEHANVIQLPSATPHLAYLARVACGANGSDRRDDLPGADIIALVDGRARDAS